MVGIGAYLCDVRVQVPTLQGSHSEVSVHLGCHWEGFFWVLVGFAALVAFVALAFGIVKFWALLLL